MVRMSYVKRSVITAACIGLCVVLPMAFHAIPNAGSLLSPMHIPVLLSGLICGWSFGLLCGLAGPLLSTLITGMPLVAHSPPMLVELAVYGLASGSFALVRTKCLVDLTSLRWRSSRRILGGCWAPIFRRRIPPGPDCKLP